MSAYRVQGRVEGRVVELEVVAGVVIDGDVAAMRAVEQLVRHGEPMPVTPTGPWVTPTDDPDDEPGVAVTLLHALGPRSRVVGGALPAWHVTLVDEVVTHDESLRWDPNQPRDRQGRWSSSGSAPLAQAVLTQGGFTAQVTAGGVAMPTEGIAVAVPGHSAIMTAERFRRPGEATDFLDSYLATNAEALDSNPRLHVGGWYDTEHEEVVLDLVEVYPPDQKAQAIAVGRSRGEQAVYDLGAGEEIDTGGTGGREQLDIQRARTHAPGEEARRHDAGRAPGARSGDGRADPGEAPLERYDPSQPRDRRGRWSTVGARVPTAAGLFPDAPKGKAGADERLRQAYALAADEGQKLGFGELDHDVLDAAAQQMAADIPGMEGISTADEAADRVAANVLEEYTAAEALPGNFVEANREWYPAAHTAAAGYAEEFGITGEQAAASLAALSPSRDWGDNLPHAGMALKRLHDDTPLTAAEAGVANDRFKLTGDAAIRPGERLSEMPVEKAAAAMYGITSTAPLEQRRYRDQVLAGDGQGSFGLEDRPSRTGEPTHFGAADRNSYGSLITAYRSGPNPQQPDAPLDMAGISSALGQQHKVRCFYNNIADPYTMSDHSLTADTHAIGVGVGYPISQNTGSRATRQSGANVGDSIAIYRRVIEGNSNVGTGQKGGYPIVSEGYRRAASKVNERRAAEGLEPLKTSELQSITWSSWRMRYPPGIRDEEFIQRVGQVRSDTATGKRTREQAAVEVETIRHERVGQWLDNLVAAGKMSPEAARNERMRRGLPL